MPEEEIKNPAGYSADARFEGGVRLRVKNSSRQRKMTIISNTLISTN